MLSNKNLSNFSITLYIKNRASFESPVKKGCQRLSHKGPRKVANSKGKVGSYFRLWRFDPSCGVSTQVGSFGYNKCET